MHRFNFATFLTAVSLSAFSVLAACGSEDATTSSKKIDDQESSVSGFQMLEDAWAISVNDTSDARRECLLKEGTVVHTFDIARDAGRLLVTIAESQDLEPVCGLSEFYILERTLLLLEGTEVKPVEPMPSEAE